MELSEFTNSMTQIYSNDHLLNFHSFLIGHLMVRIVLKPHNRWCRRPDSDWKSCNWAGFVVHGGHMFNWSHMGSRPMWYQLIREKNANRSHACLNNKACSITWYSIWIGSSALSRHWHTQWWNHDGPTYSGNHYYFCRFLLRLVTDKYIN